MLVFDNFVELILSIAQWLAYCSFRKFVHGTMATDLVSVGFQLYSTKWRSWSGKAFSRLWLQEARESAR